MKINLIKQIGGIILISAVMAVSTSCEKTGEGKGGTVLSVNKEEVVVTAPAKTAEIQIVSDMDWTIETTSSWFRFNVTEGRGNAAVAISYDENTDFASRQQTVTIKGSEPGVEASFLMKQLGLAPVLNFSKSAETINYPAGSIPLGLTTNLTADEIDFDFDYGDGDPDWITSHSLGNQLLNITYKENESRFDDRSVVITLTYNGTYADDLSTEITITQHANAVSPLTITKVKALPAGGITDNVYVEGVVIVVGHGIATDGNDKMPTYNYKKNHYIIQDDSGNSLVFASGADDYDFTAQDDAMSLAIGDRIKLLLLGAAVETRSEVDGFSYPVVTGVTDDGVLAKTAGQTVTIPELNIKDITDAHVNTLVKLKEVEVALPFGKWNNANRAYAQLSAAHKTAHDKCAFHPTPIMDKNGDWMHANINYWTPWAYGYKGTALTLQEGSGPLTGIVVRETNKRMGVLSTYQIRPRGTDDIQLKASRDNGFSALLAEWDCGKAADHSDTNTTLKMTAGTAVGATFFKSNATKFGTSWRDNVVPSFAGEQGPGGDIANGMIQANWWRQPVTAEVPVESYWIIKVPTTGVTTQMSLQFRANGDGAVAPADWAVEYSLDEGANWVYVDSYDLRGGMTGSFMTDQYIPGLKTYNVKLPAAICNKPMVYIRMIPNSDNTTGGTGSIGSTAHVRMAHVSLKYNK